jgi:hypothetical protein
MNQINTFNKFIVGRRGEFVRIERLIAKELSTEDALLLAAWIVAIVGDREQFDRVYEAVCSA